jgi:hypothetical protein
LQGLSKNCCMGSKYSRIKHTSTFYWTQIFLWFWTLYLTKGEPKNTSMSNIHLTFLQYLNRKLQSLLPLWEQQTSIDWKELFNPLLNRVFSSWIRMRVGMGLKRNWYTAILTKDNHQQYRIVISIITITLMISNME